MEKSEKRAGLIAATITAILMALLLGGIYYYWDKSQNLTAQKSRISARADSLLATKLQLEDDIHLISEKLATATTDNESLQGQLAETKSLLRQKDALMRSVSSRSKRAKNRPLDILSEEVAQLRAMRDSLAAQLAEVRNQLGEMNESNQILVSQNQALEKQVSTLTEKMQGMVPKTALTADGFRVNTVKRNNKETAKAKKIHELKVTFTVPVELGLTGTQEIFLSLTDLQNNPLPGALQNETITTTDRQQTIAVHGLQMVEFGEAPRQVVFILEPTDKLKPGTYRASVFAKNAYIGTVEFTCRNSFLFF